VIHRPEAKQKNKVRKSRDKFLQPTHTSCKIASLTRLRAIRLRSLGRGSLRGRPGVHPSTAGAAFGSGGQNLWLVERMPLHHPVKGPILSARSKTRRAGAPRAKAKTSASEGLSESALLSIMLVFSRLGASGRRTLQIVWQGSINKRALERLSMTDLSLLFGNSVESVRTLGCAVKDLGRGLGGAAEPRTSAGTIARPSCTRGRTSHCTAVGGVNANEELGSSSLTAKVGCTAQNRKKGMNKMQCQNWCYHGKVSAERS
jgi:hypothetical protein